jgi:hypothetical protein
MSKKLSVLLVLVLVFAIFSPVGAKHHEAKVYIVHGIPAPDGLPVDISVDGACALQGFTFGNIAGPVVLPAGTYSVAIRPANPANPCANDPILGPLDLMFEGGKTYSVVAHLTAGGSPTATLFEEDLSGIKSPRGRIIVHHTAAAPEVDIRLMRGASMKSLLKLEGLANPQSAAVDVLPGMWNVSIAPAGTDTVVFGPIKFQVKPRTAYLVYAVGSLSDSTFTLLTKAIPIKR